MIKNNIKLSVLVLSALIVSIQGVYAADLSFNADTKITINSKNYIIASGSGATTLAVAPTTITVTVPAATTFTLVSPQGYLLGNDQSIAQACTGDQNSLTLTGPLTDVIITPVATVCTNPGTGGSGSGGSVSTTPSVTDTTPPTDTSIVIAGGAGTTGATAVTLTLGATGATQMTISNDSAFTGAVWETYATSKSWTLTAGNGVKTVYAKFKDAAGNVSTAVSDTITHSSGATVTTPNATTPATTTPTLSLPYANPTTAAEIAANRTALISYIVTLLQTKQTGATVTGIPAGFKFANALRQGSMGNDVKYLQIFLNSDISTSIGNSGKETTYFGGMTKDGVGKFQIKYGLVSGSSDAGYGLVGPKTRAKINSLLGL